MVVSLVLLVRINSFNYSLETPPFGEYNPLYNPSSRKGLIWANSGKNLPVSKIF